MKRFVLAITLTCALSASTLAGEMHTTGTPEPVPGDAHSVGAPAPGATQGPSIAATIVLTVLSLIR